MLYLVTKSWRPLFKSFARDIMCDGLLGQNCWGVGRLDPSMQNEVSLRMEANIPRVFNPTICEIKFPYFAILIKHTRKRAKYPGFSVHGSSAGFHNQIHCSLGLRLSSASYIMFDESCNPV